MSKNKENIFNSKYKIFNDRRKFGNEASLREKNNIAQQEYIPKKTPLQ